MSTSVVELSNG
jgi:2-hydroxy-6-oxonona-2,4-dienedioate hydrolase